MVYAPGHFQRAARRRERTRRERLAVRGAAVIALILLGLAAFSLTNHQRQTGNGCIDFNYMTMIGGSEMYKCGAEARRLCATPRTGENLDTDFQTELYAACRKARIPTGGSSRTRS